MAIKTYNPTTPSRRGMTGYTFEEITGKAQVKSLIAPKKRTAGRNSYGRITVRHRGGGAKKHYRIIDFKRDKDGIPALLLQLSMIKQNYEYSSPTTLMVRKDTSFILQN